MCFLLPLQYNSAFLHMDFFHTDLGKFVDKVSCSFMYNKGFFSIYCNGHKNYLKNYRMTLRRLCNLLVTGWMKYRHSEHQSNKYILY